MKGVLKNTIALCLILCLILPILMLSGCGDDDDDDPVEEADKKTEVVLTLSNYETYLGLKLASISYTPSKSGSTYTANWTIETYSMNSKYEFKDVKITISGTEKNVTSEGYTSRSGSMPTTTNYWKPSLKAQKISGIVIISN